MLLYLSVEHGQIFDEAGYVYNHFILCVCVKMYYTHGIHNLVFNSGYKQLTGMCLDG